VGLFLTPRLSLPPSLPPSLPNTILPPLPPLRLLPPDKVVIVGERRDSQAYVRMKKNAAKKIGFNSVDVELPDTITQAELVMQVEELNARKDVHGILVQLPLPDGIDAHAVLKTISVEKDADGFHALNVGNMWISGGDPPLAVACTPAGCAELLQRYDIPVSGKNCVVLGRSNIVGMPMVCLLQSMNGTVTCCHSRTKDIADKVRQADILVVAIGRKEMVKGDWVKPGAVVIDVGMHQVEDKTKKSGRGFVGDVAFKEVSGCLSELVASSWLLAPLSEL
jgi:5,10-methylene-tetrahydrofolate dehydrogenase/methenyl tetrahydrofolate cyclohydrolase